MTDNRVVGRIIRVSRHGWGFISCKQIEFTRIFFHWTALKQNTIPFLQLKNGMMVEFTPLEIPGRGWRALHIEVLKREEPINEPTPTDLSPLQEQ